MVSGEIFIRQGDLVTQAERRFGNHYSDVVEEEMQG